MISKKTTKLQTLVRQLQALTRPATIEELRSMLSQADVARDELTEFIRFNPSCYARNPVISGKYFELLCICWKCGQSSLIHDHKGSACGVRVVAGELVETIFESVSELEARPVRTNRYSSGYVCSSVDKDIHQISNFQMGDRELITLHIYSPPLATMQTYSSTAEVDESSSVASLPS